MRQWRREHQAPISRATALRDRDVHSARMKARNPINMPGIAAKMTATRRANGTAGPRVRGGNGYGPTVPEATLAELTGLRLGVAVPTGRPRGTGYPTCYKLDLANLATKLAVEVDGASHLAKVRKVQDAKKDGLLRSLGWTVLRFSNRAVMERSAACALEVLSTISKLKARTRTSPTG